MAVTERRRLDPAQARNVVHVIQADIARLPIRLGRGSLSQSELLLQLASDVDILADVLVELIDAVEADSSAQARSGRRSE
jgi:hypothetical protein